MTPAPKQPGYGYLTPAQSSPDYPQYPQPATPFTPQPFDINALFKILGVAPSSTTGSSGTGGIGGPIGSTPLPLPGKSGNPVGTYNPGFLGMPMPISPQGPLPDISTMLPAPAPQVPLASMPGGPIAPPPAVATETNPYEVYPQPPMAPQAPQMGGMNVGNLLAALRAMQGRSTAPQAPVVPERTMPIQYDETPLPPNVPMSDEQRKRMLQAFMGGAPRMPQGREGAPRMGPSPTMRGSGMGLEGILQGIEASKQSSR